MHRNPRLSNGIPALLALASLVQADNAQVPRDQALDAWLAIRHTLDRGTAPGAAWPSLPPEAAIEGVEAAAVTLRLDGRIVGRGQAEGPEAVRSAFGEALREAGDDAVLAPLHARDPVRFGRRVAVELEAVGEPRPVPGSTFADVCSRIEPGLDAIAVRRGERFAWLLPSTLQATDTAGDLPAAIATLLRQLDLPQQDLATLAATESVAIYRARPIRLAQRGPTDAVFESWRGSELVPPLPIDRAARAEMARGMASWLCGMLPQEGTDEHAKALAALGLPGGYLAAFDRVEPLTGSPPEQAISALALASFAESPLADESTAARASASARRILDALGRRDPLESDPRKSVPACAFALLAWRSLEAPGEAPPVFVADARAALASKLETGDSSLDVQSRALLLSTLEGTDPRVARERLDVLWSDSDVGALLGALPWLAMAERRLGTPSDAAKERARELLEILGRIQVRPDGAHGEPDCEGGFLLTGAGQARTGSQSSRPGTGAAMLAKLVDEDPAATAARQQPLLRFLRQLQYQGRSLYSARNPARAVGGVRAWPWSAEIPAAGTAMALLCVVESDATLGESSPTH